MFLVLVVNPITGDYGKDEVYFIRDTQEETEKEIQRLLEWSAHLTADDFILYNLDEYHHTGRVNSKGEFC